MTRLASSARNENTPGKKSGWKDAVIYSGVLAAMIGAFPQMLQLYQSYEIDVPTAQVPLALAQASAWERSGDCLLKTRSVELAEDVTITVGACEKTGDIQVRVANRNGIEVVRWIESIRSVAQTESLDFLISKTQARTFSTNPILLTANSDGIICSRRAGKGQILQRIRENGQCFDLLINTFTGKVLSHTPAPCTSDCKG